MPKYIEKFITEDIADALYNHLATEVKWGDGIKSRRTGFTRKATPIQMGNDEFLDQIVISVIQKLEIFDYSLLGIYLNWYQNGDQYTPNHSHPKQTQVIISLGATRTLKIGRKEHKLGNGDVIQFGSEIHGVPKEPNVKDGRISIALFLMKE